MKSKILAAAIMLGLATSAQAATYSFTAAEYNGNGSLGAALVQTWNVVLNAGEHVVSASFASTWGNSTVPNTSVGDVTVGGNTVGSCSRVEPCWSSSSPTAFSYTFTGAQFASLLGSVDLFYNQTDCCVIRLGTSTLTIQTSVVPIPAAGALLFPAIGGLVALRARRRRQLSA